jgi:hypothetical protein
MSTPVKNTAKKLDIQQIYLSASSSAFYNDFDPSIPNQLLTGQFVISTIKVETATTSDDETKITNRFLRCYIQAGMRYILGEPTDEELSNDEWVKGKIASEISAIYCAQYVIRPDAEISEEEKEEFGKVNAPYHVWPYWREYAQSTCNRMNLPVSTVPMLIIEPQPKKRRAS